MKRNSQKKGLRDREKPKETRSEGKKGGEKGGGGGRVVGGGEVQKPFHNLSLCAREPIAYTYGSCTEG